MPTTKILTLQNIITLNNCLFICDQLCNNLPNASQIISNFLKISADTTQGALFISSLNVTRVNTETYGSNSIKIKSIKDWNKTTKKNYFNLICFSNEVNMLDLSKHLSRH